jgi:hypothetical protein
MRLLVTWLVVGALVAIGLFALRDALVKDRAEGGPAETSPVLRASADTPPPAISSRAALVSNLESIRARGALYLTDAGCRRFVLSLPALHWERPGRQPATDCNVWARPPVEADSGIAATQVSAETIEVTSGGWSHAFRGTSAAFKLDGTLTFVRRGRLFEWTARCAEEAKIIRFDGLHEVPRCIEQIAGAPRMLREVAWLDDERYAAIAGPDGAASVLVVDGRRERRLFNSVGARLGALQASPGGRYLTARVDGTLALFRTDQPGIHALPPGGEPIRAITWSPDARLAAVVTETAVQVFPVGRRARGVRLPISMASARWR